MSDNKTLSFTDFRARVGDLRGKEYWRSLEELSRSGVFDEFMHQEFPQQAIALDKGVDRRDFMKLMGASVAMAGLAACAPPGETIVPYVNQPESLIPGKPLFFASAMPLGGVATGVLVESHMNRPTKIEGNPSHPASLGASDAMMQAAILGLYDPDRSQVVRRLGDTVTWGDFIAALQPALTAAKTNGASLRILTQTVTSPTLGAQMQALLAQYPGMKWHQWEAVNGDSAREGGRLAFGAYVHTHYDFTKANVVVSLGSDFLGEGPGHLRYARDFMSRRKIRNGATSMNRLYALEGSMSNTGSVADHRVPVKPSQLEDFARQILAGQSNHPVVATLIKDLQANRGQGLVIAGDEQPAVLHALAHAINTQLGNIGTTVLVTDPIEVAPTNQLASLMELVRDMNAGQVQALIILGGNPVFDAPADLQFAKALAKVPLRVHHSLYYDETSLLSHWHVPDTHWLETWGDARGHDGTISIIQPLIAPLYNGRAVHEVLGALIGGLDQTPYQTVRTYWFSKGATEDTWRTWLHEGVVPNTALPIKGGSAAAPPPTANRQPPTGIELELRHDPTIYDGRFANNSWLQELPKPQTKITWDNVLLVGPKTADQIGFDAEDRAELFNLKKTRFAELSYRGVTMRLPVWVVPGYAEGVATVYFGYGRRAGGAVAVEKGKGFDTYPLRFYERAARRSGREDHHRPRGQAVPDRLHAGAPVHRSEGRRRARHHPQRHARGLRRQPEIHAGPAPRQRRRRPRRRVDVSGLGLLHQARLGDGHRHVSLHRVQRLRRRLPGGEQHRHRRQGRSRARARDALAAHRPLLPRRRGEPRGLPPAGAVHAVRERALRAGLPRRGHLPQRGRPERHDLQPLRRHALLLQQLPVQSPPLQLLPLRRLRHPGPQADAQPGRHRPHARRHGEVYVLRAAHQPREDRGREGQPPRPRRRSRHRLPAGLPDPGHRLRRHERSEERGRAAQGRSDHHYALLEELQTRPRTTYLGNDSQPAPGPSVGRTGCGQGT